MNFFWHENIFFFRNRKPIKVPQWFEFMEREGATRQNLRMHSNLYLRPWRRNAEEEKGRQTRQMLLPRSSKWTSSAGPRTKKRHRSLASTAAPQCLSQTAGWIPKAQDASWSERTQMDVNATNQWDYLRKSPRYPIHRMSVPWWQSRQNTNWLQICAVQPTGPFNLPKSLPERYVNIWKTKYALQKFTPGQISCVSVTLCTTLWLQEM